MNKNIRNSLRGLVAAMMCLPAGLVMAMLPMADDEMGAVTGQALFVADRIVGSGAGAGFTYTRVGLDVEVALNANINKWQLGCGGFNESIVSNSCDIDMDYVTLMGRSGSGPGAIGSDFKLTRPYIEIVTTGSGSTEEVVGIKIGAQSTDGYFGVGRVYKQDETNLENGSVCSGTEGNGALACHSGLNRISGYLNAEISGSMNVTIAGSTSTTCFGQTTIDSNCSAANTAKLYRQIIGSRINEIRAPSIPLKINGGLAGLLTDGGYADLTENLRFIHGFALVGTSDFGLSFQRQKVAYPSYDKASYSYPANAGWWMNVPDVKSLDIQGAPLSLGLLEALDAFSEPGVPLTNIELNSLPPNNCWGGNKFC